MSKRNIKIKYHHLVDFLLNCQNEKFSSISCSFMQQVQLVVVVELTKKINFSWPFSNPKTHPHSTPQTQGTLK